MAQVVKVKPINTQHLTGIGEILADCLGVIRKNTRVLFGLAHDYLISTQRYLKSLLYAFFARVFHISEHTRSVIVLNVCPFNFANLALSSC